MAVDTTTAVYMVVI